MKTQVEQEMQNLKDEKEDLLSQLNSQQSSIEQQFRQEEENLKKRHSEEIRKLEEDALARAKSLLNKEEYDVHHENIRLVSDMNMQRSTLEDLKREKKVVLEQNKQLKRDKDLLQSQVTDCASKQNDLTKTIKALKEKTKSLEESLQQVVEESEKEKEMMVLEFNQKFQEKDSELNNLRHQVKLRTKELKNIRGLSQMILDQRSDVEQFFLESLEQIKDEVKKRMASEGRTRKLPKLGMRTQSQMEQVELSDLDWEDRERVLRLLFSKMNVGVPPHHWRD